MFEAWKRSLDATIEVPDCEPAINAPSPRGKREPRVGGGGRRGTAAYDTPCASLQEEEEEEGYRVVPFERRRKRRARGKRGGRGGEVERGGFVWL